MLFDFFKTPNTLQIIDLKSPKVIWKLKIYFQALLEIDMETSG